MHWRVSFQTSDLLKQRSEAIVYGVDALRKGFTGFLA